MIAVWKRELQSYFKTPIGYVFMGFFLLLSGLFFVFNSLFTGNSNVGTMLNSFSIVLLFLIPILTMRLFTEERKNKSEQLLFTSPVSLTGIVVGKFLAAITVWLITLCGTFLYITIFGIYGTLYWGEIVCNYIGVFLLGCCFIAVNIMISAMTENQVTAAVASFTINFFIWIIDSIIYIVPVAFTSKILQWLSIYERYGIFTISQLSFSAILYFLSFCFVFLFLTVRVIDKRRWSEG